MSNTFKPLTIGKFLPFTAATPIGTMTNMGVLTHFDHYGNAHFIKDGVRGWAGKQTFHFVQIPVK